MGTDIHGIFQRHNPETGKWEDIPSEYKQGRHYQLFAVLAGVRNGTGFAGTPYGEAVEPISEPRGFPTDFQRFYYAEDSEGDQIPGRDATGSNDDDGVYHLLASHDLRDPGRREYYKPSDNILWMGDHSHSWLTGEEMLAWGLKAPTVKRCGVIGLDEFKAWDRKTPPQSYCGWISGRDIRVIEQREAEIMVDENIVSADAGVADPRPVTHVRIIWEQDLREELAYFFNEVMRLVREHGRIRFVFGFDS